MCSSPASFASVLWGQDTLELSDTHLVEALYQEADTDYSADGHRLEVVVGRVGAVTRTFADGQGEGPPGFPQLEQPPLTNKLFGALLGLQLPAVLNLHPERRPERLVALRVRLERFSRYTLVWCLDGYSVYGDHRLVGVVIGRCVADWTAILVRGLDARWRAISYDRLMPAEEGQPQSRRRFILGRDGIYAPSGELLRRVRL
jgi:hypothetical protein